MTIPGVITLQDIADRCGVSRATVSGALRGDRRQVAPANMARILAMAQELGYDPRFSHNARRLRYASAGHPVESGLVLLCYPLVQLRDTYNVAILRGIALGFRRSGHGMLIGLVEPGDDGLLEQLPIPFRRGEVDAVLAFPGELDSTDLDSGFVPRLRGLPVFGRRPVVTMVHSWPDSSCVRLDDRAIGRLQARHLLELGHRELVWFWNGRPLSRQCDQRRLGHLDALAERGLAAERHLRCAPWVWSGGVCYDSKVAEVLARWPGASGFMCTGDSFAVLLHGALQRLGRRVPRDCSLIGADDAELLADDRGDNLLSTIRLPLEEVGRQAAAMVIRHLLKPSAEVEELTLAVELVARATTAAPPPGLL